MEVWAIRILSLEHDYKEITLPWQRKEIRAANSQKPTSKRRPLFIIVCFYDTYTYYYIYEYISLRTAAPYLLSIPTMTYDYNLRKRFRSYRLRT
jgi:hypothetical protein